MSATLPRSLALLAGLVCFSAVADEQHYNQISLHAEASSEVAYDRMQVTLYSEAQHQDPTQLAADTTETLNKAVSRARKAKGITVSQGSRSSYPVYGEDGTRITGWRERAELRLESGDFTALSELTADLLDTLKMGSMNFSVSDALRKQNEDVLLKDAVAAFRARAQLTTEALGGSDYRIVSLNLGSGGYQPVMRNLAMKSMESMDAPDIAAGTRQVSISADGVIEVEMP